MIKVKVNNEYKDVVKIFCGGTLQKEIIKVWSREAQEYVYESSVEYTGSLPITINANGDALIDYRIYGADGGVGVATENLFNIREVNNPPKCSYSGSTFTLENQGINYDILCKTNGIGATPIPERMIAVSPGTYTIILGEGTTAPGTARFNIRFFDGERITNPITQDVISPHSRTFTVENNGYLSIIVSYGDVEIAGLMITKGSTAPTNYIPYGYKLPMVVQSANLFDPNAKNVDNGYIANAAIGIDGVITTESSGLNTRWVYVTEYIPVDSNTEYIIFTNLYRASVDWARGLAFYDENKNFISAIRGYAALTEATYESGRGRVKFTTPENCRYIRTNVDVGATMLMLVAASIPPPAYIPYSKQTVPVYIGENQLDSVEGVADYVDKSSGKIVRRIKEYTFTGNENWAAYGVGFYTSSFFSDAYQLAYQITTRFSHFTARSNVPLSAMSAPSFGDNCGCFWRDYDSVMMRSTSNFTTVEECKAYFKSQYDNGTPVKMWYIMKTPVEENPPVPLPEIPTIDGTTIIDYDGTPKPSQMYVKYRR